jgi:quaternary ammonium compound-resistance protein SugE
MAWFYLLLAGALETAWAFGMKQSAGFTPPNPPPF